jgi:hypothetical protein
VPKNRFIILPFLILAWTIIFAHSIIPHHHHSEEPISKCTHGHTHEAHFYEGTEIHDCDHDCNDHACHFHVDVLTQVSIDNIFLVNTEDTFFKYLSITETSNNSFYIEFVSDQIPQSNYLRGPPIIS